MVIVFLQSGLPRARHVFSTATRQTLSRPGGSDAPRTAVSSGARLTRTSACLQWLAGRRRRAETSAEDQERRRAQQAFAALRSLAVRSVSDGARKSRRKEAQIVEHGFER
jgi:hypothetical protein